MERKKIPIKVEPVDDCNNCNPSACCLKNTIIQLTDEEVALMRARGTRLITQLTAAYYDRSDALYAVAYTLHSDGRPPTFYVEEGRETEPLEAGYGRYIMTENCANLQKDLLGRTSCAIYNQRPRACETFQEGGEKCHQMQARQLSTTF